MCGFYREHVPNFAQIAKPLKALTRINIFGLQISPARENEPLTLKTDVSKGYITTYPARWNTRSDWIF